MATQDSKTTPQFIQEFEEWRDVPNYEGKYQASSWGHVRSLPRETVQGHLIDGGIIGSDERYPRVTLANNGKRERWLIHRLVAHIFLGPCPEGKEVNHINGDKTDNRIQNLEYITRSENNHHRLNFLGHEGRGSKNSVSKLVERQVVEIRKRYASGETQVALAKEFGVDRTTIRSIVNRKNWAWLK